jgi:RHS repeat-associated protein
MPNQHQTRKFFYQNRDFSLELAADGARSVLRIHGVPLAQTFHDDANDKTVLITVDQQNSVLALFSSFRADVTYTPHGYAPFNKEERLLLGFNGQRRGDGTGLYYLGNGYRPYSSTLSRFYSSDSWSPFDRGELNAYAYCAGDPVNRTDPTGHMWRSRTGNTPITRGRQPASRQRQRFSSISSSRDSSVENVDSVSSSRSRSRSPVLVDARQSYVSDGAPHANLPAQSAAGQAGSRRSSTSSMSSTMSLSELNVPLNHRFDADDAIANAVLQHMDTHADRPIDQEIFLRFNEPTTTIGMPDDVQNLEMISAQYGVEWFNMARLNLLKRRS